MKNESEFYKVSEIARMLNMSKATAYRWVKSKKIMAIRIGKTIRIPKSEIERVRNES